MPAVGAFNQGAEYVFAAFSRAVCFEFCCIFRHNALCLFIGFAVYDCKVLPLKYFPFFFGFVNPLICQKIADFLFSVYDYAGINFI